MAIGIGRLGSVCCSIRGSENHDLCQCLVSTDCTDRTSCKSPLTRLPSILVCLSFRTGRRVTLFGRVKALTLLRFTNRALSFGVAKTSKESNGRREEPVDRSDHFFSFSFTHPGVTYIDFSPNERYMVTVSANPSNTDAFIVWDTITGARKRGFPLDQHSSSGSGYFK